MTRIRGILGISFEKLMPMSLTNLTCLTKYEGHGLGLVDSSIITEELTAACAGISGMIGVNSLACGPIIVGASYEQKMKFLLPLNQAGETASFGLTER
jgi:acyl-CoA dehydrogenase